MVTQNFVHLKSKKAVYLFTDQKLMRCYYHISTSLVGVYCQFIPKILTIGVGYRLFAAMADRGQQSHVSCQDYATYITSMKTRLQTCLDVQQATYFSATCQI